jgi:hypothetical protein
MNENEDAVLIVSRIQNISFLQDILIEYTWNGVLDID